MGKRHFLTRWNHTFITLTQDLWTAHHILLLRSSIFLMIFCATIWLSYEFYRLFCQPAYIAFYQVHPGAIDLKIFHKWIHLWFAGEKVYGALPPSTYPPASFLILWPILGWLKMPMALYLWAATMAASMGWILHIIIRESGADKPLYRIFVCLIPLSMYATGATIGNGQLIIHVIPLLITAVLVLKKEGSTIRNDLLSAILFITALVKPSVSIPFFWIVLFVPNRIRPACLIIFGYFLATYLAVQFQGSRLIPLLREWFLDADRVSSYDMIKWSHNNLHSWLASFGLQEYNSYASLCVLACLGLWTYYHRHCDIWHLLGVSAIVSRIWTYHGWYDDLLILLPIIALFRISKRDSAEGSDNVIAGILLGLTILVMLAPGGHYLLRGPWLNIYMGMQVILWGIILLFLIHSALRERKKSKRMYFLNLALKSNK